MLQSYDGEERTTVMLIERNKTVVRAFIEAINAKDWGKLDECVAAGVVRHSRTSDQPQVRSRDDLKTFLRRESETFPDAHESIRFLVAEGDKVAARLAFQGTQRGALGPFPASGKTLSADFICIFRLEGGQSAEVWAEWDTLDALVPLGHFTLLASLRLAADGLTLATEA
jgi:steroid delta-isomerase-like uncharacterized protein